jgi:ribosome biogenesis protein ERB1
MAKRNAERKPVKPIESESGEDELDELNLDGEDSSEDADSDVDGSGGDGSSGEGEPGTASGEGEDEEIEEAILELMAAQAERAQRRAAARMVADDETGAR